MLNFYPKLGIEIASFALLGFCFFFCCAETFYFVYFSIAYLWHYYHIQQVNDQNKCHGALPLTFLLEILQFWVLYLSH
jgi:hypothetical protein